MPKLFNHSNGYQNICYYSSYWCHFKHAYFFDKPNEWHLTFHFVIKYFPMRTWLVKQVALPWWRQFSFDFESLHISKSNMFVPILYKKNFFIVIIHWSKICMLGYFRIFKEHRNGTDLSLLDGLVTIT